MWCEQAAQGSSASPGRSATSRTIPCVRGRLGSRHAYIVKASIQHTHVPLFSLVYSLFDPVPPSACDSSYDDGLYGLSIVRPRKRNEFAGLVRVNAVPVFPLCPGKE